MNILITGANGQLGSEIRHVAASYPTFNYVYVDLPELDITNEGALHAFARTNEIQAIVNCAAYTAVDKSESEIDVARKVNADAVGNLVRVAESLSLKLIHISTDYVFDGSSHLPYNVDDPVSPLGAYGVTKREGEEHILRTSADAIIIRTAWLYSAYGNNFVKTMLRLGSERDELNVIYDQIGSPTYAHDLAVACLEILKTNAVISSGGKVYHYTNEGVASWYDFTKAILEKAGIECRVNSIETKDYPTPAKRPYYSVLNKIAIKEQFALSIPYWRDSLDACLKRLLA